MEIRSKEALAENLAKALDDAVSLPGSRMRIGIDPIVGLVPIIGDVIVTIAGAIILIIARQLNVQWDVQLRMAYNLFKNGFIGAIPFIGDLYSFGFKSHQLNAALLVRSIKRGDDGTCPLRISSLTIRDFLALAVLIGPTIIIVGGASLWFWSHHISLVTILYPSLFQSRTK
ncbi:MAG TPA: DUF4112 domain-containing protein [Nitrospira sp.]